MANQGKTYPVLNRGRFLWTLSSFPRLPPTEFKWTIASWFSGSAAGGAPLSGRGVLPNTYVQGELGIVYSSNFYNDGTHQFTHEITIYYHGTNPTNDWGYRLLGNGVVCWYGDQLYLPHEVSWPWIPVDGVFDLLPGPASALLRPGDSLLFKGVTWKDSPGPPRSTPF